MADVNEYLVYCYDPSQDRWTNLPPLPVRYFGLGQVRCNLVAVGGEKSFTISNGMYTYNRRAKKWKDSHFPALPTARSCPDVLSFQSALVVAGGHTLSSYYTAAVDIFKPNTSQWHRTDPLPIAGRKISMIAIGDTCYTLGGFNGSYLNRAFYASVDDLLHKTVPANQTTHSGNSDTQSVWKTLPNTPVCGPAAAVLADNLLAIGGKETPEGGASKKEVYVYFPSTNSWIYIGDLCIPRSDTAVAILSQGEILVIGGLVEGKKVSSVSGGTLTCTMNM